jgi:hypothetical protein
MTLAISFLFLDGNLLTCAGMLDGCGLKIATSLRYTGSMILN